VEESRIEEAARYVRCARCRHLYLGVANEFAGDLENAAKSYQAFLDDGFFDASLTVLYFPEPVIHERLGGLYEALGNPEKAVEHYTEFASQWADAEAGLLPRVEKALQRATALKGGGI
jgi:tetratricopeptide (TPR) repeat protein